MHRNPQSTNSPICNPNIILKGMDGRSRHRRTTRAASLPVATSEADPDIRHRSQPAKLFKGTIYERTMYDLRREYPISDPR